MRPRHLLPLLALLLIVAAPGAAKAIGVLVPTDRSLPPLALRYHRVHVELKNGTAVTKVEQVFRNHTSRDLEATFLFPMPEQAVLLDFALWMNGQRVEGKVLPRDKARRIYEDIVRRMRDPGLIEWMDHGLFQARVYPVPARGEQKIEIAFTQVLPCDDAVYRYIYPLRTSAEALRTLEDFTIDATIEAETPLRSVYSPTHRIHVKRDGEHKARVSFEQDGALLQKDFRLLYTVGRDEVGLSLLTHHPPSEAGYFLLMATPKATWAEEEILGKEVIFVVDTSGSMANEDKMARARDALRYAIEQLRPEDRFNIVRFSTDVEAFRPGFVAAKKEREAALSFVDSLEPAGGTAIHEALLAALEMPAEGRPIIVFLTDGRPTVGETEPLRIIEAVAKANTHDARVFAFGVGDTVNTKLLDRLSRDHGGVASYVKPGVDMESTLRAFYAKLSHPVLSDLELELKGVPSFAVLPRDIPDLFRGDQLVLLGRYRGEGDMLVRLTGTVAGERRTYDWEGTFPAEAKGNAYIAQLWAHRQVGFLLEEIRLQGEQRELVDEVKQLALRFGIVTPYTSYLVTEPTRTTRPRGGALRPEAPRADRTRGMGGAFADGDAEGAARYYRRPSAEPRKSLRSADALAAESGSAAVQGSKAIRDLKEEEVTMPSERTVRYTAGRVFVWRDGWVDEGFRAGMPTIKVKKLSDAYFELLKRHPKLRPWLALGGRVTVVVGKVALVVGDDGAERLSPKELARIAP